MANTEDGPDDTQRARLREERLRQLEMNSRFSTPFGKRVIFATTASMVLGGALGTTHGSRSAGYRFRAENAHRLPTSPTGWYLYHKSKNYQMAYGGLKEAARMSFKLAFWTGGFLYVEDVFDRYRGTKDFVNTIIASLSLAGAFSVWNRFPIATAAKTAKGGLAAGVIYGVVQDALGAARGRTPGYVDFIRRRGRRKGDLEQIHEP